MAALTDVLVPDIGDAKQVTVIEILVAPGTSVAAEDPLVTLESDKATMDVPAPAAGVVHELKVAVGDEVTEGSQLLTLTLDGEADAPASAAASAAAVEATTTAAVASAPAGAPAVVTPAPAGNGGPPYASPGVRRLARELGADLRQARGSGPKGRILKEDVRALLERSSTAPPSSANGDGDGAGLGLAPWPQVDFEKYGPVERVPLSRIQKISGANLARNWVQIPHVTHQDEADITDLEAFRKQLNGEQDVKVTMVALLMKACVASLKAFPQLNASLDGEELVLRRSYNIGFAADTPQGLVVPVIRDADAKGILELAAELAELSGRARAGKLGPASMQGGTFTISSLGGIGGTGFTPIVNAPEVAILGVTRSAMKPIWDGAAFVPRLMVPLSLSYDHRVIDGAAAARFTAHLARTLTDLRRVML